MLYTAIALVLSGIFSVIAAATLFGGATDEPNGWYYKTAKKANDKLSGTHGKHKKNYIQPSKLHDHIASVPEQLLITSVVVLLAVRPGGIGLRGKYWARWTTLGLWIMATLTGTLAGISSLLLSGHPTSPRRSRSRLSCPPCPSSSRSCSSTCARASSSSRPTSRSGPAGHRHGGPRPARPVRAPRADRRRGGGRPP